MGTRACQPRGALSIAEVLEHVAGEREIGAQDGEMFFKNCPFDHNCEIPCDYDQLKELGAKPIMVRTCKVGGTVVCCREICPDCRTSCSTVHN